MKRVHVATGKGFEALAVCELDIQHAAVCVHQRERIELANVTRIAQNIEVRQSTSKRSPAKGSMRTKARLDSGCGRTLRTYSCRMAWAPL